MNRDIDIWTDGSCYYKDRIGGWGAVIIVGGSKGIKIELSGSKSNTTSNRMELTAVLMALKSIKTASHITVYSDSMYVVKGIHARGWFREINTPKNADLWKKMNRLLNIHYVIPEWVKGHAGIEGNERADKLAGDARKRLLKRRGLKWK